MRSIKSIKINITHHIGLFGNSPGLTPVVCNKRRIIAVISVLDYRPKITNKKLKICQLCKDLLLEGITRGAKKGANIRSLQAKIKRNIKLANKYSDVPYFQRRINRYCDAAHKYEEELINLYLK